MALILNIDTSGKNAFVNIAENGKTIAVEKNNLQNEHSSFLHIAIKKVCENAKVKITDFTAVAVVNGPGSYTGLRVGLSAAKGLCFALNIPIITVNALELLAIGTKNKVKNKDAFYAPMIDARRMEVFMAMYDWNLKEIIPTSAIMLNEESFSEEFSKREIYFFGNGMIKFREICANTRARFVESEIFFDECSYLTYSRCMTKTFNNIILCEPLYVKEFYYGK